jgi:hypothetical protein
MMFSQQPLRTQKKLKKQWEREKKLFEKYVAPGERKRAASGDVARLTEDKNSGSTRQLTGAVAAGEARLTGE